MKMGVHQEDWHASRNSWNGYQISPGCQNHQAFSFHVCWALYAL
jgi:hypothetical protein